MNIGGVSINWFDLVVVGVIGLGFFRGRRRGMSEELLDLPKWLGIVVVGGLTYRPVGEFVSQYTHVGRITGLVLAYLAVLLFIRGLFAWVKRMVGEKLLGSDVFGSWEYYLGMIAGAVRFSCYLIVTLALLNAAYMTPEELAAQAKQQRKDFEDISFPTLGSIQHTVFTGSASGRFAGIYLAHELIVLTPADQTKVASDTLGHQRERAVSEVLGERK